MAKAADKATAITTLVIGQVEVPVALFSTQAQPGKLPSDFTTAGPHGGKLKAQAVARPAPVSEPVDEPAPEPAAIDPLAEEIPAAVAEPLIDAQEVAEQARENFRENFDRSMAGRAATKQAERWYSGGGSVDGEYGRELVEEGSGDVVAPEDVRRGIRLDDGRFIDCTEQLAQIDERTRLDRIEIVGFVENSSIPRLRVQKGYYLGSPAAVAPKALRLLYEGMKSTRRAGIAKLTKKSRQTLAAIVPFRDTLALLELTFARDFRPPPERAMAMHRTEVTEAEVQMMTDLIRSLSETPGIVDTLEDDAIVLREQLRDAALRGEVESVQADLQARSEDDRLMAQLTASLAGVS